MQGVRGQKRTAPKTFDAGIALYAGMAALSGGGRRAAGEGRRNCSASCVQVMYKLCTFYMHFLLLFSALYGIMVVYVPCGENSFP